MLKEEIKTIINNHFTPEKATYILKLLKYNTFGGWGGRLKLFNHCLRMLKQKTQMNIAFCIGFLQSAFLIIDEIITKTKQRKTKQCWYKINNKNAAKDGLFITKLIALILKELIKDKYVYKKLMSCLNYTLLMSCIGKSANSIKKKVETWEDVESIYNYNNYEMICFTKNNYYTFYLPLKFAYIIADITEPENLEDICNLFGVYHQIIDDFLSYVSDASKNFSRDIEDRKLTWITCKIAINGNNDELLEFFRTKGYYSPYIREKAKDISKLCLKTLNEIKQRILAMRCKENNDIIEYLETLMVQQYGLNIFHRIYQQQNDF